MCIAMFPTGISEAARQARENQLRALLEQQRNAMPATVVVIRSGARVTLVFRSAATNLVSLPTRAAPPPADGSA